MNHLIHSIHLGSNVCIQGRGKHYQLQNNMINKLTLNSVGSVVISITVLPQCVPCTMVVVEHGEPV